MEHSKNFNKVLGFFRNGLWSVDKVRNAVGRWITEEEFTEITGEEY